MVVGKINLDKVGACASAVCAVHCLLTGVALGLLSVAGLGFLDSLWTDVAFLGTAFCVGSFAVYHGIKSHHSVVPAMIFAASMVSVVCGHFLVKHGTPTSTVLSVLGGCGFVAFHLLNLRLRREGKCACGCES